MNATRVSDRWERGSPYEQYIGRWSRRIAPRFLTWLDQPMGRRWLDVGSGTGALSAAILDHCAPSSVVGVEPSEGVPHSGGPESGRQGELRCRGCLRRLPLDRGACDVVVSGLVLNFVPALPAAFAEMRRVTANGGTIAATLGWSPMEWRSSGTSGTSRRP